MNPNEHPFLYAICGLAVFAFIYGSLAWVIWFTLCTIYEEWIEPFTRKSRSNTRNR